jgi:hypothetical protein
MPDEQPQNTSKTGFRGGPAGEACQWKPGQSGNPGGRPRNKPITTVYQDGMNEKLPAELRKVRVGRATVILPEGATYLDWISLGQCIEAGRGKPAAAREIADRLEGGVAKPVEVSGPEGGPLDIQLMTDEQLDARIRELMAEWQKGTANEPET